MTIGGHRTSVRLEREMWEGLDEICRRENLSLSDLCDIIDQRRRGRSRTSAIRVFVLSYFRVAATDKGHQAAGHGGFASHGKEDEVRARAG